MAVELTDADRELLQKPNFAHFSTLMPDGSPQTTPVWVDAEDGLVIVNTAEGRTKIGNIRRDPRVALSICNNENPYQMISIRGRVVEDTHDGADEHIDKMAMKYLGKDEYPFRQPGEERVVLRIEPMGIFRAP